MKKIYLIAAVAALAVGVATYLFASELKATKTEPPVAEEKLKVLVAVEDIPQNTILTADMFETVNMPKSAVTYGTVSDANQVIGFMSTEKILKGEQVMARKIGIVGGEKAQGRLSYKLSNGKYAVTVLVDAQNAIAYALKEGDKVNVYSRLTPEAPVLEKVMVLAIGDYTANVQQNSGIEIMSYAYVTLEVTKEQIPKLINVEAPEILRLVLVSHAESYELGAEMSSVPVAENVNPEPVTNEGMGVVTAPPPTTEK